jgi:hypothetical protein
MGFHFLCLQLQPLCLLEHSRALPRTLQVMCLPCLSGIRQCTPPCVCWLHTCLHAFGAHVGAV